MDVLIFLALLALGLSYFVYALTAWIFGTQPSGKDFLMWLLAGIGLSWLFRGADDHEGDC
jgi:hypothetical protein